MASKQLIRTRNTLKQKLSFIEKYVNSIKSEGLIPVIADLEFRITNWEALIKEFDTIQNDIESKCEEASLNDHFQERENFEFQFYEYMGFLKQTLKANINSMSMSINNNTTQVSQSQSQCNDNLQSSFLPKIKLPTFKGDFEHWLEFKTNFLSIVHNNPLISTTNKYNFLRTSVEGYAKQIVYGFDFIENQYDNAWAELCKRFDKKRVLVNNHVKAIFSIDKVQKEDAQAYRKLLDEVSKHLTALKSLKLYGSDFTSSNFENSNVFLMYLISSKLDKDLQKQWEEYKPANGEMPTLDEFFEFLSFKADALENWQSNQITSTHEVTHKNSIRNSYTKYNKFNKHENRNHFVNRSQLHLAVDTVTKCNFCKGNHLIYNCSEFLKFNPKERLTKALNLKLCVNCLKFGHSADRCFLSHCKKCTQKHSTLLHSENMPTENVNLQFDSSSNQTSESNQSQFSTNLLVKPNNNHTQVLLSTVLVKVKDSQGNIHQCRALLDSGAQSCLVRQDFCNKLNLNLIPSNLCIVGINQVVSKLDKKCSITIFSNYNNFQSTISCYVVPTISSEIPSQTINVSMWNIPANINLADPEFSKPQEVQMLIGASLFWELLVDGKIELGKHLPILHNSKLGWVMTGTAPLYNNHSTVKSICNFTKIHNPEDEQLKLFWELEEVAVSNNCLTTDETQCEKLFNQDTIRNKEGQFIVKFPFKHSPSLLGNSSNTAIKRFYSLEKNFAHNSEFKSLYVQFINEYSALGHMSKIQSTISNDSNDSYYLPHHGVFREQSITTKLRVVFDGSCRSDTGWSLNDLQYVGPKIQNDISHFT
jgi:Protein of unknown function (DUF1759)/Putative peptidase (DUF1758)